MANEQNLKPIRDSEMARKLQEKSVEARRKNTKDKKNIRLAIEALLEKEFKGKDGNMMSGAEAIAIKQMEKALKGDTKAFETVRDTAGQKPIERVEQINIDAEYEQSVEYVRRLMEQDEE